MNFQRKPSWVPTLALLMFWTHAAFGQAFSSGSTGADGPLNITTGGTTNVTVKAGGIYHHTTVNIAGGQTLRYLRGTDNAPVVILATGDVTISGTIDVSGSTGSNAGGGSGPLSGAAGGPGGFDGGMSGFSTSTPPLTIEPTAGKGPGGGAPSTGNGALGGTYGAPAAFVALTPLFGGSGGGGGQAFGSSVGASGGGGGGAILIASSTRIIVNGQIRANGGNSGAVTAFCTQASSTGTGGAIRLVAPDISGGGNVQALRGTQANGGCGTPAGDGRIRFEAVTVSGFTGTTNPVVSVATAPGAVFPAGNPQLSNVPTLQIVSVGGVPVPGAPAASYFTPDIALAAGTSNPVQVVVSATNTPVGAPTAITVRVLPQGNPTNVAVASAGHVGTFASSTATANVTLPVGQVSVLQASAAMTLTGQIASLFPAIDGEPVERVAVVSSDGGASVLSLITRSGKEKRLDQLEVSDQLKVAQAWEVLKATRSQ